jgi:hypothetical protein
MGGTTPWRSDESGRSCCIWPKTPKRITKNISEKHVEEEGEIRKRERVRGGDPPLLSNPFKIVPNVYRHLKRTLNS